MSYQMTDIIYLKFSINSRYVFFNQPTLLSLFLVTEPLFTIKNAFLIVWGVGLNLILSVRTKGSQCYLHLPVKEFHLPGSRDKFTCKETPNMVKASMHGKRTKSYYMFLKFWILS